MSLQLPSFGDNNIKPKLERKKKKEDDKTALKFFPQQQHSTTVKSCWTFPYASFSMTMRSQKNNKSF